MQITRLIDVVGHQAALELVRGYNGRRLYIRKRIDPDSPLAMRIGYAAAQQLSTECGGDTIEIPVERNALIKLRDQAIVAELTAGETPRDVAARHGLSARHVRHIRDVQSRESRA